MRRWTRRLLWMLSTLVALAVGVAAAGLLMADYRINRRVDVRVASFPLPGDAGSRGARPPSVHLARLRRVPRRGRSGSADAGSEARRALGARHVEGHRLKCGFPPLASKPALA